MRRTQSDDRTAQADPVKLRASPLLPALLAAALVFLGVNVNLVGSEPPLRLRTANVRSLALAESCLQDSARQFGWRLQTDRIRPWYASGSREADVVFLVQENPRRVIRLTSSFIAIRSEGKIGPDQAGMLAECGKDRSL